MEDEIKRNRRRFFNLRCDIVGEKLKWIEAIHFVPCVAEFEFENGVKVVAEIYEAGRELGRRR